MAQPVPGGTVLGKYRILRQLTHGGMGTVFLGQTSDGQQVVIKWILHSRITSTEVLDSLKAEIDKLLKIRHPGIVGVLDFGEENQAHFLVNEYVHGFNLNDWNQYLRGISRQVPVDVALLIAIRTLRALHHAHTVGGVLHRDATLANVLLGVNGDIRISDFGVGRVVSGGTAVMDASTTKKFAYLPPELVTNIPANEKTDIYSIGLMLHELFTGKTEFAGNNVPMTLAGIMNEPASKVSAARSDLPAGLDNAIAKALEKKQDQRFATADEFANVLAGLLSVPEQTAAETLRGLVAEDFNQPQLAEISGLPSLAERASGQAPAPANPQPMLPISSERGPDMISGGADFGSGNSQGNTLLLLIVGAVFAAIIVAGALLLN